MKLCVLLVVACAACAAASPLAVFPVPRAIAVASQSRPLAPKFSLQVANLSSPHLEQVIQRYTPLFVPTAKKTSWNAPASALVGISISIASASAALDNSTNVTYSIRLAETETVVCINAATSYGAMYGLETLSQLLQFPSNSDPQSHIPSLPASLRIDDSPAVEYRGLTLDVGRRISPISLLKNIVQGMSFTKMNALHLSLSGPVVRLEITAYPELVAGLTANEFYSQKDMKDFVAFAQSYGVRVIPEMDVPAHCSGLRPLEKHHGLTFCDGAARSTIAGTTTNLQIVNTIFDEVVSVFSDPWVHIGGDEVTEMFSPAHNSCSVTEVQLVETSVQNRLHLTHRKTPVAWNEVFSVPANSTPNAAIPGITILQNWKGATNVATTSAKFRSIDSNYKQLYLNEQCCRVVPNAQAPWARDTQCFWVDVLQGLSDVEAEFMAGGATAMWSDNYCPSPICSINGTYGWMYPPSQDSTFSTSFSKSIWPKAAAAGAAFWNFDATVAPTEDDLQARLELHNTRLIERGVVSCANGCTCDWGYDCGKPYGGKPTPYNSKITIINKCTVPLQVKQRVPCDKRNGPTLFTVDVGGTSVVNGSDFIIEAKGGLAGDPFDLWIGDGTWMNLELTLAVTDAGGGYLAYIIEESL